MALLIDVLVYGVPFAIGLGALKALQGRYYGKKDPQPDDGTKPKDE